MTSPDVRHSRGDDDDLVPASIPVKLALTAAPFVLAGLVYAALRWLL